MKIQDIKRGFVYYVVYGFETTKFEYFDKFPSKPMETPLRDYHIVINRQSEKPERIYGQYLQDALDKGIFTYEQAKQKIKQNLQNRLAKFDQDY